jgi:hypothetical protein
MSGIFEVTSGICAHTDTETRTAETFRMKKPLFLRKVTAIRVSIFEMRAFRPEGPVENRLNCGLSKKSRFPRNRGPLFCEKREEFDKEGFCAKIKLI